jgi:hypothetical protein
MAPSSPDATFKKLNAGEASPPLTLIFSMSSSGGSPNPRAAAKALISSAEPGSWNPNWLQGKAWMTSPWSLYLALSSANSL